MEMHLWNNYGSEEINEKIKYWVDLWDDLISNFNKKSYGLKLINPQLLINDIIDEIESNDFKNLENKKYFYNKLNEILKDDPIIKEDYKTEFCLIRKNYNDNKFYVKELCKEYQNIFKSGEYFNKGYSKLKQILLNPIWEEKDKKYIAILTQHLIIDFIIKGYDIKTIQRFPENIFDKYIIRDKESIETKFPHQTNIQDYKCKGWYDFELYTKAIKEEIDGLSIEDRLNKLSSYYFSNPEEVYFIFEIEGLKGNIDIWIGPVNFYSPKIKTYEKEMKTHKDEFFKRVDNQCFLNAAVKIKTIDYHATSNKAIEEIEKALDMVKVFYNTDSHFEVSREVYLVVGMDGIQKSYSFSASGEKGIYRWLRSLNLKEQEPNDSIIEIFNKCSEYIFTSPDKQNIIQNRISHSLHWFRKGTEAKSFEDKLVNYWVSIENLLDFKISLQDGIISKNQKETPFSLACELVPPIIISNYIYNVGWELYGYLTNLLRSDKGEHIRLNIPENIINDCNLNFPLGTEISLRAFIMNISNLLPYISQEIIKEKIIYTDKFYSDPHFCKTQIENRINEIKNDILLLYRYRNKIIHNAHYDNTILPYYVEKARKYSVLVCGKIASTYDIDSKKTLEELFVKQHIKVNELIEKINNNIVVDLFKV